MKALMTSSSSHCTYKRVGRGKDVAGRTGLNNGQTVAGPIATPQGGRRHQSYRLSFLFVAIGEGKHIFMGSQHISVPTPSVNLGAGHHRFIDIQTASAANLWKCL